MNVRTLLVSLLGLCAGLRAAAQVVPPLPEFQRGEDYSIAFNNTPLDMVLQEYSRYTGRFIIQAPNVPQVNITIRSPKDRKVGVEDYLRAVESVLSLNGVTLVPEGDKFLRVRASSDAIKDVTIIKTPPEQRVPGHNEIHAELLPLKNMEIDEATPIIQELLNPTGKITPFPRISSLLIMDTASNFARILDLMQHLDIPVEAREKLFIISLVHAKAGDVAGRITELIAESQQAAQQKANRITRTGSVTGSALTNPVPPAGRPPTSGGTVSTQGGVIRVLPVTPPAAGAASAEGEFADQGIVQGRVKMVPDERTNKIFMHTRQENYDKLLPIINALDEKIAPTMTFEVIRLEFSTAEDMAGMISGLIGVKSSSSGGSGRPATPTGGTKPGQEGSSDGPRGETIRDYLTRRAQTDNTAESPAGAASGTIGDVSEETRIISDTRTNSIVVMGREKDIKIIKDLIRELDVMLAQVLVEAVIIEVNLNDHVRYGVDWLQRSMVVVNSEKAGPNGGVTVSEPVAAFGGASRQGAGDTFLDAASISRENPTGAGALTYFGTLYDLNIDAIITLAAGSGDTKVLATPVILTTDNTEAKIQMGEKRPIPTSSSTTTSGSLRSTYEYMNIGIELTVKPRINPKQYVSMEIKQSADNVAGSVTIDSNPVPIITARQLSANVTVPSRTTIVLGGLVRDDVSETISKVPLLGDLPLLGWLFRSTRKETSRTELLVLITPYVLVSAEDAILETRRLKEATNLGESWPRPWSDSPLGKPLPESEAGEEAARVLKMLQESRAKAASELLRATSPGATPGVPAPAPAPEPEPLLKTP